MSDKTARQAKDLIALIKSQQPQFVVTNNSINVSHNGADYKINIPPPQVTSERIVYGR